MNRARSLRLGLLWGVSLCLVASALTACSAPASLVVVRKSDGFYVADSECPAERVATVEVTPLDQEALKPAGRPWIVTAPNSEAVPLPPKGLKIGGDGAPWGDASPQAFDVAFDDRVLVTAVRAGGDSGQSATFALTMDVGQYVDHLGSVGEWADLVGASDCLEP